MASTQDRTNLSSSHRLPTISAADALQTQQDEYNNAFSTGLQSLDGFLDAEAFGQPGQQTPSGGLIRGHVYEAYGPPGSGKTAFGLVTVGSIQAAADALRQGMGVVWIDTASSVPIHRLEAVVTAASASQGDKSPQPSSEWTDRFEHYTAPTVAHLIALLGHPASSFPPKDTGLIVVDTVSSPFATAFPRALEEQTGGLYAIRKNDALSWASGRRWALMSDLAARIAQLAASTNTAVLLLSQASTKMRTEHGTLLRPALSTRAWLETIHTRLVLFGDSEEKVSAGSLAHKRLIGVVKHAGMLHESLEHVFPFVITNTGLKQAAVDAPPPPMTAVQPAQPAKRKREEIGDSESDDADSDYDEHRLGREGSFTEEEYMQMLETDPVGFLEATAGPADFLEDDYSAL